MTFSFFFLCLSLAGRRGDRCAFAALRLYHTYKIKLNSSPKSECFSNSPNKTIVPHYILRSEKISDISYFFCYTCVVFPKSRPRKSVISVKLVLSLCLRCEACPELVPKVRSRMGRMDLWLNIIEFSESSVSGVYPEFIPESCSPDSQQGNVSSLDFLSGVAKKIRAICGSKPPISPKLTK